MDIVEAQGQKYKLRFKSHFVDNSVGKKVRETACYIFDATTRDQISEGIVMQNSKDADIKKIGQKMALGKALSSISKNKRRFFWDVFLGRPILQNQD